MTKTEYAAIENHMLSLMKDSAHDRHHVYRVLYSALDIAAHTDGEKDTDILIAACLLHDIGRGRQFENPKLCHAREGAAMAYDFLLSFGWEEDRARHVRDCVSTHRYRADAPPRTIEAKILFDADKLDVTGAIGIARTLSYEGTTGDPLYTLDENGSVITEGGGESHSFFQEYNFKLKKVYGSFHTAYAAALAEEREKTARNFYEGLLKEVTENSRSKSFLTSLISE